MPDKAAPPRSGIIPSKVANRYIIRRLVGQGGMADVYQAYDEIMAREVAIKILRTKLASDPQTVVRFLREASSARSLSHPNVVEIYDVGESGELHYLVMEYIPGLTLKELIQKKGPMPASQAVEIMKSLTSAVMAAHANQIIHRDIKPQNILIGKDGTLKITDFGIALAVDTMNVTRNNAVMGSSHYLAPESAAGMPPDFRVDIYALGIVFFELLCGSVPFTGQTPAEIALKHMQDPLPSIRAYNDTVSQGVENVVIQATAKNPSERFQTSADLLAALNHCEDPDQRHAQPLVLKTQSLSLPHKDNDYVIEMEATPTGQKQLSHVSEPPKISWKLIGSIAAIVLLCTLLGTFALMSSGIMPVDGWFGWHRVPPVQGLSQQQAVAALVEAGIPEGHIQIEQIAADSVDPGHAESTSIPSGRCVRDEQIVLRIASGPTFLVPDYTGQYLEDVEDQLARQGLQIEIETSEQGTADTNPGVILEQSGLEPGSRIDPSRPQKIHFVISAYPNMVIDPSYIGMNIDEAKEDLNQRGMAVITRSILGSDTVQDIDPPVGTFYTQEGSDSVITLYH